MKLFFSVTVTAFFILSWSSVSAQQIRTLQYSSAATNTVQIQFRVQLPDNYSTDNDPYPVLLYLHGAYNVKSIRSFDTVKEYEAYLTNRINVLTGIGPDLDFLRSEQPFIVISPVSPHNRSWFNSNVEAATLLLRDALQTWHADPDRVYITGPSGGAIGTWTLSTAFPELYAALLPMMGFAVSPAEAGMTLTNIPVKAYCGGKDTLYSCDGSRAMVDAINRNGGNAELIIMEEMGHGGWGIPWSKPATYEWLLQFSRQPRGLQGPPLPDPRPLQPAPSPQPGRYAPLTYSRVWTNEINMPYRVYLPQECSRTNPAPALFYFGGARTEQELKGYSPLTYAQQQEDFPAIVFAVEEIRPRWNVDEYQRTLEFYRAMLEQYPVDTNRIYTTGWGRGGKTAHMLNNESFKFPRRIPAPVAATLLISAPATHGGFQKPQQPFWLLHGEKDTVYPAQESRFVYGDTWPDKAHKLSLLPDADHTLWRQVYRRDDIYDWLFNYRSERRFGFKEVINIQDRHLMPASIHVHGPVTQQVEQLMREMPAEKIVTESVVRGKIRGTHNTLFGYQLPLGGFNQNMGYYLFPLTLSSDQKTQGRFLFSYQGEEPTLVLLNDEMLPGAHRKLTQDLYWEVLHFGNTTHHAFDLPAGTHEAVIAVPIVGNGLFTMRIESGQPDLKLLSP